MKYFVPDLGHKHAERLANGPCVISQLPSSPIICVEVVSLAQPPPPNVVHALQSSRKSAHMMLACLGALPLACAAQARRDYASRGIGAKAMPCKGTRTGEGVNFVARWRAVARTPPPPPLAATPNRSVSFTRRSASNQLSPAITLQAE